MSRVLPELPYMARHGLAAVMELACLEPEERLTSNDLAERTGVSRPILAKVLRALSAADLVDGVKGHHGGYRLARDPEDIRLVEVLSVATGTDRLTPECALGVRACNPENPCALHHEWIRVIDEAQRLLMHRTLADVVPRHCKGRKGRKGDQGAA